MQFKLSDSTSIPISIEVDGELFLGPDGKPIGDPDADDHAWKVLMYALVGAGIILVVVVCLKMFGGKNNHKRMSDDGIEGGKASRKESAKIEKDEIELSENQTL